MYHVNDSCFATHFAWDTFSASIEQECKIFVSSRKYSLFVSIRNSNWISSVENVQCHLLQAWVVFSLSLGMVRFLFALVKKKKKWAIGIVMSNKKITNQWFSLSLFPCFSSFFYHSPEIYEISMLKMFSMLWMCCCCCYCYCLSLC